MNSITDIARSKGDPKVLRSGPSSFGTYDHMARALGWFSIGLGLTHLLAPRQITRSLGMWGKEGLVRTYGAREIASGILTLSTEKHVGLWSRVAGDGLDLAALIMAVDRRNPRRDNAALALAMVAGITMLDLIAAQGVTARRSRGTTGTKRQYGERSGFPQGLQAARGAARDFKVPQEMRTTPRSEGSTAAEQQRQFN